MQIKQTLKFSLLGQNLKIIFMHFIQMEEIFFIQFILTIYKKYLNRTAEKTRFAMNNIFYFYISVNLMKKKI